MTTLTPFQPTSASSGSDLHGNPMTGSPAAIEAYDRAIDRLLRFDVDVMASLEELMTEHAGAPMTHVWRLPVLTSTARALDDLLPRWPTDLLALAVGQQLDFSVGDALKMCDRIGRSLGALGEATPTMSGPCTPSPTSTRCAARPSSAWSS